MVVVRELEMQIVSSSHKKNYLDLPASVAA